MRRSTLWLGLCLFIPFGAPENAQATPAPGYLGADGNDAMDRFNATSKRRLEPTLEVMRRWDAVRKAEALRWHDRMPGGGLKNLAKIGAAPGQSWVNIGPTDAVLEYNGSSYAAFDTGRPNAILVDPRNANVVYYGASAGGVWKTYNFRTAPNPTWLPLSEGLTDITVGAMALDPNNPDVLYVGTGDPFDVTVGGTMWKSSDGGASWAAPVVLTATYSFQSYRPISVRDIKVDPNNSKNVLVGSRAGLFRSTDGGATYAWIDLPNGATDVPENVWNIIYVGGTSWLATGVSACSATSLPPGIRSSPASASCPLGRLGDIWRSDDSGATWTSQRAGGTLPKPPTGEEYGRITVAAGAIKAAGTTVYAYVGNADLNNNRTLSFWRSKDGGKTWVDATGTLSNPTVAAPDGYRDCGGTNVGHGQTWYNQALAVDPSNDDHVIAGGNLCGIRTLNGSAASPTWENISHWLPIGGELSTTADGPLPYVHADWHTITIAVTGTEVRVFSGNDGGIYSSTNVFDPATKPTKVVWNNHNRGIATHLIYGVGSGDPVWGNGIVSLIGLQDNGTFMRWNPLRPTVLTGIGGGDGIGAAVNKGTAGEIYWISSEFTHYFCVPTEEGCNFGSNNWWVLDPPAAMTDNQPFFVAYSPILTDPTGVGFLTQTDNQVWQTDLPPGADLIDCSWATNACKLGWKAVSPDFSSVAAPNGPNFVIAPVAARNIAGLIGAVLDGTTNAAAVSSDGGKTWTWSAQFPNDGKGHTLIEPSSLDFPPQVSAGKNPGDEYVVSSSAPYLSDISTPVPDTMAHLFQTTDRGKTLTPINGAGGTSPLPNVPIFVVKYDPSDAKTIYVGTQIGVYRTTDNGATWERFGSGLPMAEVRDLFIAKNQDFIRAATYGRGLWEIYPSASEPMGRAGDGDYDLNQQIDWVDLAAMASRLGTTPATLTPPLYSYLMDMVSGPVPDGGAPVAAIDDNDLTALLGRFGDHP